jgi:dsRNA-specific ribonuclease
MRILEDTFEAFIAAIYLDNGDGPLQTQTVATSQGLPGLDLPKLQQLALDYRDCSGYLYCQRLLINLYERYIDMARLVANDDNYKDQLQSQFQKLYAVFPTWTVLKEELSGLGRQYTIGVFDPTGFLLGTGRAYNKTEAEQQASRQALIQMGALKLDEEF